MRSTVTQHIDSLGYSVDACESYEKGMQALENQYQKFGEEYTAVVFGWPVASQDDASAFAKQLDSSEHKDLPVLVMSTDMRAETRAWAAVRDKTSLLPWRGYQALKVRLDSIVESANTTPDGQSELRKAPTASADNGDIHVLVVDDSATIRFSVRDLLHLQGYKITLASTRDEAMQVAAQSRFDIAVLDYYLTETTGDVLCRELLSDSQYGDLICVMFTGTYSDHIIKRSLRAGAVECMFKNESSELILSRIDAISRIVRQRRQMQKELVMLENVIECIAGASILVDREGDIRYVNSLAAKELGIEDRSLLLGISSGQLLAQDEPLTANAELQEARWHLPGERVVDVDYQSTLMDSNGYGLIRFARREVPIEHHRMQELPNDSDADSIAMSLVKQFSLPTSIDAFMRVFLDCLEQAHDSDKRSDKSADNNTNENVNKNANGRSSLLMLDVFIRADESSGDSVRNGGLVSVSSNHALAQRLYVSLQALIAQENHVTMMGDNRFGLILRHSEESQAYVMTRKVMQHCIGFNDDSGDGSSDYSGDSSGDSASDYNSTEPLVCTASLLSLTRNAAQPANALLQHAFKGMDLVNAREPNQAILLDVRRLLSADPVH